MTANRPMMQCGHRANAHTQRGGDVCAVCYGLNLGADRIDEQLMQRLDGALGGRTARCYCGRTKASDSNHGLAYFKYRPTETTDSYYCGCDGWD